MKFCITNIKSISLRENLKIKKELNNLKDKYKVNEKKAKQIICALEKPLKAKQKQLIKYINRDRGNI